MNSVTNEFDIENFVNSYFSYVKEMRNGADGAVEKLISMWDETGVFEFIGAPPVKGTFKGISAIQTLYKNRFNSSRMNIKIAGRNEEGNSLKQKEPHREVELGFVETEVKKIKVTTNNQAIVTWSTIISTKEGIGFSVSGTHRFTFTNNKISKLKIVISPKPEQKDNLKFTELAVQDIGRLSLAAWAVV